MDLREILSREAVRTIPANLSRHRLLLCLGEIAAEAYGVDARTTAEALERREYELSTSLGLGVALPHARIAGVERIAGIFVRLKAPVRFAAPDRRPVDLVFGMIAPLEPAADYLKFMASAARKLRNPDVRDMLRSTFNPELLHRTLIDGPEAAETANVRSGAA